MSLLPFTFALAEMDEIFNSIKGNSFGLILRNFKRKLLNYYDLTVAVFIG